MQLSYMVRDLSSASNLGSASADSVMRKRISSEGWKDRRGRERKDVQVN